MHFKDVEAFKKVMIDLNQKSLDELETWIVENEFNTSLYLDSTSTLDVPDPAFRAILNKDQLYIVGDEIRKITKFEELAVKYDQAIDIETIDWKNSKKLISTPIKIGNVDYSIITAANRKEIIKTGPYNTDPLYTEPWFAKTCVQGPWGGLECNYDSRYSGTDNKKVSAHLEVWNRTYLLYASAGIRIKGRERTGGKWRNSAMTYASIDYEARGTEYISGIANSGTLTGFVEGYNTQSVDKTIFHAAGLGAWIDMDYFSADFAYQDNLGINLPIVYRHGEFWDY